MCSSMYKEHITTKKPCVAINDGSFFISASLNVGLSFPSSLYLLSSYLEYSMEGKDNQMEQRVNMTITRHALQSVNPGKNHWKIDFAKK